MLDREPLDSSANLVGGADAIEITASQRALMLRKTRAAIAGKSLSDLEAHLGWYLQFLYLTMYKKKIVSEWKIEASAAQNKLMQDFALEPETEDGDDQQDQQPAQQGGSNSKLSADARMAQRERIAKWRMDQATQKSSEEVRSRQSFAVVLLVAFPVVSRKIRQWLLMGFVTML